jgi:hypothetical protein
MIDKHFFYFKFFFAFGLWKDGDRHLFDALLVPRSPGQDLAAPLFGAAGDESADCGGEDLGEDQQRMGGKDRDGNDDYIWGAEAGEGDGAALGAVGAHL